MSYDLKNLEDFVNLKSCNSPQDDITFIDRSVILLDDIGKNWVNFEMDSQADKIFLSNMQYYSKLNIKFILRGILDCKKLTYSTSKGHLEENEGNRLVITGQINIHNLNYVNISNNIVVSICSTYVMIVATSMSSTDPDTW